MRTRETNVVAVVLLTLASLAQPLGAQEGQSCSEKLTEQLRRLNEKCLADLVSYVASQPKASATVRNESEKYFIRITHAGPDLQAEAVSKQNYPFMKEETAAALKDQGWTPPENEFGNFKRSFSPEDIKAGRVAPELAKALAAYGMTTGEAMSITAGPAE